MVIYSKIDELTEKMISLKSQNFSVGFVPTMGALHAGHLSLIDKARDECQIVVVSIFVNPIQFNNPEDLKTYPRTLEQDIEKIKDITDILFVPTAEEIYPTQPTESYNFGDLENVMEGVQRPGHFNGVAIVVNKLLDIVQPDKAYFGEKDFQQLAIVKKLVEQCRIDTTIVACPTIRESSGLAMSSRNQRLTNDQKEI
ncbi:MAG TPA: pantoate--beta-alanine ligase, partial [Bacteroidales bacterium]|nr:pantoate--beta-alanine ligase [Bacteroidales bacterium]